MFCLVPVRSAGWTESRGGEGERKGSREERTGGDGGRFKEGAQQDGAGEEGRQHQGNEEETTNPQRTWNAASDVII